MGEVGTKNWGGTGCGHPGECLAPLAPEVLRVVRDTPTTGGLRRFHTLQSRGAIMATRIGINGFGRIGRLVYRAIRERYNDVIDVVAVNDLGDVKTMAHLLQYDTNYGPFPGEVVAQESRFVANGDAVTVLA